MISISQNKNNQISLGTFALVIFLGLFFVHNLVFAQGIQLSVTPTLFEMTAVPQQVWNSQVKVINSNDHELVVYADVVNFAPHGESGHGKFLPVLETFTEGTTLAEWVEITSEAIVIPPEQSTQIPFTVRVPEDVSPGGHFAAIMVGTRPPADSTQLAVTTSQIVTSLFFVRVGGDVVEDGTIREFRAEQQFVSTPETEFTVRFENKGNVHIQPQGQIVIYNMWGKERGVIPINHQTHFGNVLPDSIRKFSFAWKGESSFLDIGRYRAELTLGYGLENRKFQTSNTYFYVIPVKATLYTLAGVVFTLWFVSWCVRAYVRRMLALSGIDVEAQRYSRGRTLVKQGDLLVGSTQSSTWRTWSGPVQNAVSDLRSRLRGVTAIAAQLRVVGYFMWSYRRFFISLVVLGVLGFWIVQYMTEVRTEQRHYEIVIENDDQNVTLSSEEIIYDQNHAADTAVSNEAETATTSTSTYSLVISNASNQPGAAADLRNRLEQDGFTVTTIGAALDASRERTVIVYPVDEQAAALSISRIIGNALLSATPPEGSQDTITIYIGDDYAMTEDQ